jgi:6-phosphogluconolactonase
MSIFFTRRNFIQAVLAGGATLICAAPLSAKPKGKTVRVYFGTYTNTPGASKGIYLYDLDLTTGALTDTGLTAMTPNPSFLAIAPNRKHLYAVNEIGEYGGKMSGSVTGFAINSKTGGLTLLNTQASMGTDPCHIRIDAEGRNALVANYSSGSNAVLPIGADGKLAPHSSVAQHTGSSVDRNRQEGPHAHSIYTDASGKFALSCDLGTDKIYVYRYDAKQGKLTPNDFAAATVPPGSGPRHLALSASRRFVYAVNEMLSTVTAFEWNEKTGELITIQSIPTLPADFTGHSTTAEIALSPNGKFLYASNRGHDSLAIFSVNPQTGLLHSVAWQSTLGKTPRSFAIEPTGNFLVAANQDSDSVATFRIAPDTGLLSPLGALISIPAPVCVLFAP